MLSEKITDLFRLLQCGNTDIARFAGCSPSNISRLKSGLSEPAQSSRTVLRLAEGVYRYADYENMLDVLKELCEAEDTQAETLIPAIVGWLFDERDFVPSPSVVPKSKQEQEKRRHSFGERLDKAMTLLEISNSQLAAALNVDVSLISRYRGGIYYPNGNTPIKERLSEQLLTRAEKRNRGEELARLCGMEPEALSTENLMEWLYEAGEDDASDMAEALFRSIDTFTPGQGIPTSPPQLPPVQEAKQYWGTEGLRSAVVRFLTDAAREGGELLLYSDEPMDWMSGDQDYFTLWASLMVACVRNGVHIKIIHNVDRVGPEMVAAINGWFPLYMSGRIEPYLFRTARNPRFCHTVFLHPGSAGILGYFPAAAGDKRWYDYITDREHLDVMEADFASMLAGASPILKTYPIPKADDFWQFCGENPTDKWVSILHGLSLPTMPEGLLERILDREGITGAQRKLLLERHQQRRLQLREMLEHGSVDEILCLPDHETVANGRVSLNLGAEMVELLITYTPEEYAEHIAAIREMVNKEKNYHLTLLPQAPFRDLQVFTVKDAVAVLRCRAPYTAFVFRNDALLRSVSDYGKYLIDQYAEDRYTTTQALDVVLKYLCTTYPQRGNSNEPTDRETAC